ncbi:paREP5ab [Thermoproteus uzoniensis 768-20]|uniref:PaREP5ab n=1 Tax=Thermoproteus uzoniensis (strain 768-20) TaxID=999630 RepID=F2L6A5_THEU7|nr:hypothetical protein [Thermoproteus uzoniensis]AEA12501.1 paREP5ab [Thermoproteus uzoniensis 768-20]
MIDLGFVVSSLIAQAPLVVIAIVVLYYTLDRKIESVRVELGGRIDRIEARVEELAKGLVQVREAFYGYQNALIDFLAAKGLITEPEAVLLRGTLRALVPLAKSKYYTEEVRRRLIELLDKDIKDYTWDDVAELERIAEAIDKEAWETGREDLFRYYPKLVMYIAIVRGLLRRREAERRG